MTSNISSVNLRSIQIPDFLLEMTQTGTQSLRKRKLSMNSSENREILQTNIYDVSMFVDHNISIVSVFDLEEVTN